jgi:LuxR family maltose regulon positive regulatory protein
MARPALLRLRTPGAALEEAIDELLNGIITFAGELVIVIDDLEAVPSESPTHVSLFYAVDHLPARARIVAATRFDPPIRLGRRRGHRVVAEIRANELAFTAAESRALIVDRMGVTLSADDVELLVERTEGWPAGLGLAGLWLRERNDSSASVRSFSGHERPVADYLAEEVLGVLDEESRSFLVRTSMLDRFSGRLCDAVLGAEGSARRLKALARSNLFVVPLDARHEWYRYHHLLRDALALELSLEDESSVRLLHERAAAWFLESGMFEEALEHTAATVDPPEVTRLLDEHALTLLRSSRLDTLVRWLDWLPTDLLRENPLLASTGVLAFIGSGQPFDERAIRLQGLAEEGARVKPLPVQLRVEVTGELMRASVIAEGVSEAVRASRRAVELATQGDNELTAAAYVALAYYLYLAGDDDGAEDAARSAIERPEASERPHALIYALACTALVHCERNQYETAAVFAKRSLELARRLGLAGGAAAGVARLATGQTLLATANPGDAERHLERAERVARAPRPALEHVHALLLLVEARIGRGRLQLASAELDRALRDLESFANAGRLVELATQVRRSLAEAISSTHGSVEPLTPSELPVLRLLATDLSQREIGRALYLSHNTVKTHSRAIYRKLGVNARDDAVRRATTLGLLPRMDASSEHVVGRVPTGVGAGG